MAAFIVATVDITNPDGFRQYVQAIDGLSASYGGEAIVKSEVTDVMEGDVAVGQRVVIIKFPTADAIKSYLSDPRYQAGKAKRAGAAKVDMRIVVD